MVYNLTPQIPSVRLTPGQELKLAKPATELYVGQVLKAVVIKGLDENQVLININGQNINARTSSYFPPGEILKIKVMANDKETILQVLHDESELPSAQTPLQSGLLKALPRQAPATDLLAFLTDLQHKENLPAQLKQQIQQLINSIVPLKQLPQQFLQAVYQSGVFLEAALSQWKQGQNPQSLLKDFKGQCIKLLAMITPEETTNISLIPEKPATTPPLPGSVPQPLAKNDIDHLHNLNVEEIKTILYKQVNHVLARITANQLNHINQTDQHNAYQLMIDLPIQTPQGTEVIPLHIKKQQITSSQSQQWSVAFAVNLEVLGGLQANLTMTEHDLDIQINAEKMSTLELIEQHKEKIGNFLQELGLNLRQWTLHYGLEESQINSTGLRLLDIRI